MGGSSPWEWVFFYLLLEQFDEVSNGQKSEAVMTNGDKIVANAIEVIFPEACHRLCLWHLMTNMQKDGGCKLESGFIKSFTNIELHKILELVDKNLCPIIVYNKKNG